MTRRRQRGITLIEVMVVVAIIGVLVATGIALLANARERGHALNVSHDLATHLSAARARAVERGTRVWVIFFPTLDRDGNEGGRGAYFVYEDVSMQFGTAATRNYGNFVPPDDIYGSGNEGQLLEKVYLDTPLAPNARFAKPTGAYEPPFDTVADTSACSFCSGSPAKGAIVFTPEGMARFLDADGVSVHLDGASAAERAGLLGIKGDKTDQNYLYAISGPTGFIGFYRQ